MADDDQQRQLARQEEELDLNELDQDDVLEVVEDDGEMMEPGSDDEGGDDAGAPADEDEEDEAERLIAEHSLDDSVATYRASKDAVFAVDVHPSPEAQLAVSGGADDQAHIWSTATGALVADLTGHTDSVTSVRFSRHDNGQFVATAGMDGRVRFWRRKAPGWQTWEFLTSLEGPEEVNWIDWHPKGAALLAGGSDGMVWLWQLPSGNVINVLSGHTSSVTCGRFTPDGKRVVTGSEDSTVIMHDPRDGRSLIRYTAKDARVELPGGINALAMNEACTVGVLAGASQGCRVVSLVVKEDDPAAAGPSDVLSALEGHPDAEGTSVECVLWLEDEVPGGLSLVIEAGTDGRITAWDGRNWRSRSTTTHDDAVTSLAHAKGSAIIVSASADRTVRAWDARSLKHRGTWLGHTDVIHALALSVDGTTAVTADDRGVCKVWRIDSPPAPPRDDEDGGVDQQMMDTA